MTGNQKIKILICYHKKAPLFADDILTPIHVGRAAARKFLGEDSEDFRWLLENMIGDDTGENISAKNGSYNELTALYWAWKNYDALGNPDYIGLTHYRRHFVLTQNVQAVYNISDFDAKTYYDRINYSPEIMYEMADGCDFLTHIGKVGNVYQHFIENHRKEDIDLANTILLEKYPEYKNIMDEYYAGDYSNFCNMNIFSKDLFFAYCEWLFSILEEFERRVNIEEKRLFISERLTGIFVAGLMKRNELRYKYLPITYIEEKTEIPIVMCINRDCHMEKAVTITSILENANANDTYCFYLLSNYNVTEEEKNNYTFFPLKYENCCINFIKCDIPEEFIPIYISQMLSKVNKCLYLSGRVIALRAIGDFFRLCSADDYFVAGIPEGNYAPEETEKRIKDDLLVFNCKKIRKHQIAIYAGAAWMEQGENGRAQDGTNLLNELCKNEIGYIPNCWYLNEKSANRSDGLFYDDLSRGKIQQAALWKTFLIYDGLNPVENNQGVYSMFWWDHMRKIPLCFQRIDGNLNVIRRLYAVQQVEINEGRIQTYQLIEPEVSVDEIEDWRTYGLWGKLKFYYKYNGLKNTIKYIFIKLTGERKNKETGHRTNSSWGV